jgi:hypothetical protein
MQDILDFSQLLSFVMRHIVILFFYLVAAFLTTVVSFGVLGVQGAGRRHVLLSLCMTVWFGGTIGLLVWLLLIRATSIVSGTHEVGLSALALSIVGGIVFPLATISASIWAYSCGISLCNSLLFFFESRFFLRTEQSVDNT